MTENTHTSGLVRDGIVGFETSRQGPHHRGLLRSLDFIGNRKPLINCNI